MGIISDFKALAAVQEIKAGGKAKLSISQITCLLVNMLAANKNLTPAELREVYALYKELRKCKEKLVLDYHGYVDTAVTIMKKFDKIAPYEKYSGGNEQEFASAMQDIGEEDGDRAQDYGTQ
jgi:hypothetical protein